MRILKIVLPGVLRPATETVSLDQPDVKAQLFRELDALKIELAERIRAKAITYLPGTYSVFVRVAFDPVGNALRTVFWIDDPSVTGLSALLARRAWKLSVPILTHVVREAVQERLQTLSVTIDDSKVRVAAFAPTRAWYNPLTIAVVVALLSAAYWVFAHPSVVSTLHRVIG